MLLFTKCRLIRQKYLRVKSPLHYELEFVSDADGPDKMYDYKEINLRKYNFDKKVKEIIDKKINQIEGKK